MELLSYTSTDGPTRSISVDSTRERLSSRPYVHPVSPPSHAMVPNKQLARQEHYLAAQINIRPGMKVLDVGCGVGGPAREIARFTDATIIGVNNNDFQIDRATKKTAKAGLSHRVSFQKGDFMKLSETFGENSFDASKPPTTNLVKGT